MEIVFLLIPIINWSNGKMLSNDIKGSTFKNKEDVVDYFGKVEYSGRIEQIAFISADNLCEYVNEAEAPQRTFCHINTARV